MAGGNKGSIHLTSLDDLFTTQEQRDDAQREKVIDIPLGEIHDFPDHPFRVIQDDAMNDMAESVRQFGVLVPAMVRPREDGGYELISGHRRKMASTLAGRDSLPCIVRDLSDDEAIIIMVDSNLQREQLLPSEKAKAYKMKMDAMRRQAGRPKKENVSQVETHLRTSAVIAQQTGESRAQVDRFIRLTSLLPELLSMVDEGKIGMTPAVELSYLPQEEQGLVLEAIDSEQATPSLSQAQRLRKMSTAGELNEDTALGVMMEQKKPAQAAAPKAQKAQMDADPQGLVIAADVLRKYFPTGYDPENIQKLVLNFLAGMAKRFYQQHPTKPQQPDQQRPAKARPSDPER